MLCMPGSRNSNSCACDLGRTSLYTLVRTSTSDTIKHLARHWFLDSLDERNLQHLHFSSSHFPITRMRSISPTKFSAILTRRLPTASSICLVSELDPEPSKSRGSKARAVSIGSRVTVLPRCQKPAYVAATTPLQTTTMSTVA
jgi:hypothetical protein